MKRLLHALAALWPWETGGGRPKTEERWRSGEYSWLPAARTGLLTHLAAVLRMDRLLSECVDSPIRKFAKETVGASAPGDIVRSDGVLNVSKPEPSKSANTQIRESVAQPKNLTHISRPMPLLTIVIPVIFMCLMAAKQVSAQAEPAEAAMDATKPVTEKDLDRFPMIKYDPDLSQVRGLVIGDSIPDYLWDLPLWVVNHPEGRDSITLREYEGSKLLVLDFWARWCAPCVRSVEKWEGYLNQFGNGLSLVTVHMDYDYKALPFVESKRWVSPVVIGEAAWIANRHFFYHNGMIARAVWISGGKLLAITGTTGDDSGHISEVLAGRLPNIVSVPENSYLEERSHSEVSNTHR